MLLIVVPNYSIGRSIVAKVPRSMRNEERVPRLYGSDNVTFRR